MRQSVRRWLTPRVCLVAALIVVITLLHLLPHFASMRYRIVFRGFYFLPVMLAALWFGLRGALATSISITLIFLPAMGRHWSALSPLDVDKMVDMVLYNIIAAVLGVMADRERREQARARGSESLAAVGKAVSALAHDMKTPLVAIGGFARLARNHLPDENPDREKLDIVVREAGRLESMLKEMLDFSRPLEIELSEVLVERLMGECIEIVSEASWGSHVRVLHQTTKNPASVLLDQTRMKQVVLNLVLNAVEASPEGATVFLRSYTRGRNLVIDVTDSGCGIPAEEREAVFTPFFTTKKHGTGLGLPIVRKIVESHGGRVKVLDNPSGGLTFRVVVPVVKR